MGGVFERGLASAASEVVKVTIGWQRYGGNELSYEITATSYRQELIGSRFSCAPPVRSLLDNV